MSGLRQAVSGPDHVRSFDLTDRGLLLADGVFDTSRIVRGRKVLWAAHLARLCADASALGIAVNPEDIERLVQETLPVDGSGALRVTVTRGPGGRGLAGEVGGEATLIARFTPMELPYPAAPVRLAVSDIRRNPTSPAARHKTLAYTDNIMAMRAAIASGFDDALLLSVDGKLACAPAANLFVHAGGRLVTPPVTDGAMPGVIRGWLLRTGAAAGLVVEEESLTLAQLQEADGVFLTNSLRILQPVTEIDGRVFPGALPDGLRSLGEALIRGGGRND